MESGDWAPEHSKALREYLAMGMSYSRIAIAINEKFGTSYSRSSAIGRAKRMGLADPDTPKPPSWVAPVRLHQPRERPAVESGYRGLQQPVPVFKAVEVKLRCVEVGPRHLALVELDLGDCRYPYGGNEDGEAITFCGHRSRPGSSYCAPHFHLTRAPAVAVEPTTSKVSLRLVDTA